MASYPPDLSAKEKDHLVETIKDWSIAHGLAVRAPPALVSEDLDPKGVLATTVPVTLFPSPFPRNCFEQATSIQTAYNKLYAAIARDEEFLEAIAKEIVQVDSFIASLWDVHQSVKAEGYTQKLSLGLFRSDYMVHQDTSSPEATTTVKQVEFNTIASSFGGLSSQTSKLHRYLSGDCYPTDLISTENLPENTSTQSLASGLQKAYEEYSKLTSEYKHCIIFLVQDGEKNIFDQRHLEYELQAANPSIPVYRLAFKDILAQTSIADTPERHLLYHPPHRPSQTYDVAVVYMRSGYGPGDYPDETSWKARLQLERSYAIKCPTVLTQLAGAKKVQQVLAVPRPESEPSILERFIGKSTDEIEGLEKTFTNIFPLDDSSSGQEAKKIALDSELCQGYVLKPQREGGGNNTYRSAIPPYLKSLPEDHWKAYILMEIITPPPVRNSILRHGNIETGTVICELGVYGTCLWNQDTGELLDNRRAGYLLRTKGAQSEEGGVAAGYGSMDSVVLTD